jgi:hypothetical protein
MFSTIQNATIMNPFKTTPPLSLTPPIFIKLGAIRPHLYRAGVSGRATSDPARGVLAKASEVGGAILKSCPTQDAP